MLRSIVCLVVSVLMASHVAADAAAEDVVRELNIYSAQKAHLIRPILDVFEAETGINVNVTTIKKDALTARLALEGEDTPADMVLTADIGNLYQLYERNLLQPVTSEVLTHNIPVHLRDPQGYWHGLALRSRVIFYTKERTVPFIPKSYEYLADSRLKGEVLIRSSNNIYNQSLLASVIAHHGQEKAKEWAASVVANMARAPRGGDRDQLRAVAAGVGDVAVANTYYYARMLYGEDEDDKKMAASLQAVFPNQETTGAHVNIRGAAVSRYADNKEEALRLMEFLSGEKGQQFFMTHNYEFPVNSAMEWTEELKALGVFRQDSLSLDTVGQLNINAVRIFNDVGWQ